MTIHIKEFIQRQFTRPNQPLFRKEGDFSEAVGLRPDYTGRLMRGPAWSAHLASTGLTAIEAMLYDHAYSRYVLYGTNAAAHLAAGYFSAAWSFTGLTELSAATSGLGGAPGYKAVLFYGSSYVIGQDYNVYKGTSYTAAHTAIYSGGDAWMLVRSGTELFLIQEAGKVLLLDSARTAFAAYLTPQEYVIPIAAYPFRGYLLLIAQYQTGEIVLYRITQPTASEFYQVGQIEAPSSGYAYISAIHALHNDYVYFSPGPRALPNSTYVADLYRFNSSYIEPAGQIPNVNPFGQTMGLMQWNKELVYWSLLNTTDKIMLMADDGFLEFAPGTLDATSIVPLAANLAGQMIITSKSGATQGIQHAGPDTFQDGYIVTSKLDMSHPGKRKRLDVITVITNANDADLDIIIKYRADDTAAWTTALTSTNTTVNQATEIGTWFTTMQIRVDIDDDSGDDMDVRIEAISVIYTIDD